jgi:hypothetical protein
MTSSMTAAPRMVAPSRGRRLGGGNERPPEHVQRRRAEDQAGKDFTGDRRLPDSVRECASQLGRRDDERQNQ